MYLRRLVLICSMLIAGLALLSPASALAACPGGGSSGDNQYIDPLAGCTPPPSPHHSHPGSTPTPSTQPTATPTPASTPTATPASATTPVSSTTHSTTAGDPSKTLPYTGLDIWPYVALGVGLLGSGFALRRAARQP